MQTNISKKSNNRIVGISGEEKAKEFLRKKGYKILETNYSNNVGEIDIVAKYKKEYVFVEVKYRTNDYFGLPREAVNEYKQQKIRAVAIGYIKRHNLHDKICRFDVIEILDDTITHIENCFWIKYKKTKKYIFH